MVCEVWDLPNLWCAVPELDEEHDPPVWWIGMGLPEQPNAMVVKTNIPVGCIWGKLQGVVAKDAQGSIALCHRGRVNIGHGEGGKKLFWKRYTGPTAELAEPHSRTSVTVAVVGWIEDPKFVEQVESFVREVARMKSGYLQPAPAAKPPARPGPRKRASHTPPDVGRQGAESPRRDALTNRERAIVTALLNDSEEDPAPMWGDVLHAGRPPKRDANKWFLYCILDYQVHVETLSKQVKHFAEEHLGDPADLWQCITTRFKTGAALRKAAPSLHRFPAAFDRVIKIGRELVRRYDGDARRVWEGRSYTEVLDRLADLRVGQQISHMMADWLARLGYITADGPCDVKADVHVRRVLGRCLYGRELSADEAIAETRRLHPRNPSDLDSPLWGLGRDYCYKTAPDCDECPLRRHCDHYRAHVLRS